MGNIASVPRVTIRGTFEMIYGCCLLTLRGSHLRFRTACSLVLLCLAPISFAQKHESVDPVNAILQQELGRSFNVLKTTPTPPYFISYELTDRRTVTVDSSFGALTNSNDVRTRFWTLTCA